MKIDFKKWSRPIIILIGSLSLFFAYWASTLHFNYNFEALFPTDDPELTFFQEFRKEFADDNEYLSIGIFNEKGIFNADFLQKLASCTKQLEETKRVLEVTSPANMKFLKFTVWGRKKNKPILTIEDSSKYQSDSSYIYQQPDLLHNFFSESGKAVCMYLRIENNLAHTVQGDSLLAKIDQVLAKYNFDEYHVLGSLQSQQANAKKVKIEFYLFTTMSSLLVIVFLFLVFRSMWGVVVPLLVISLCGLWSMGIMGILGVEVNLMTMMIPTIIFVVAMSDVIHLLSKYLDELRLGKTQQRALEVTVKEVGLATFLTSITTSLGFLTLLTAGVKPFVQFGLFAAVGVLLAFFITFSLLPAILILLPKPKVADKLVVKETWGKYLKASFYIILRKRIVVMILLGLVVLGAFQGVRQLAIQAYFTDEIDKADPLSKDIQFFEQQFGGIRPFELSISLNDTSQSIWDIAVLRDLEQLNKYLKEEYGVNKVYSLVTVLQAANRSLLGGGGHFYRLPKSDKKLDQIITEIKKNDQQGSLSAVLSRDANRTRISGSVYDWGSVAIHKKNKALTDYIEHNLDSDLLDIKITGSATMIDRSHNIMANNMLQGLGMALLIVSIVMGILYKNPKAIIIALIPNVLPLLIVAGIMGWLGVGLNMSTSIIFTIAFGIAVDDTIHFMAKLNIELKKGWSLEYALKNTFISTGKAIMLTSMILSLGFWVMVLSDFNGTFYMGALVGLTLILAVIADLLLIPILVLIFKLKKR